MNKLDDTLSELVALSRACRADHAHITPATLARFEELLRLVQFRALTAPAQQLEAETRGATRPRPSDAALTCSVLDCNAGFPLFNVACNVGRVEWRCLAHVPPDQDLLNPVGMSPDEREASGRPRR